MLVLRFVNPDYSRTHDAIVNDVQLYSRDGTFVKTLIDYRNYSTARSGYTFFMRLGVDATIFLATDLQGVEILNYADR